MTTVAGAINHLQGYDPSDEIAFVIWQAADIHKEAGEMGHELTDDQVSDVLRLIKEEHDCNVGINWDVIRYWIDRVLEDS
jgi:hypothetical protein